MKKSEFMKKYMRLRPTAKQWREAAEKAFRAGCIDLESAPDNFLAVYPLAGAVLEREAGWMLNGSLCAATRRQQRREANNIKYFI